MNKNSSSVLMGKATTQQSNFTCMDWQPFDESETYQYGIIAAGMNDGCVTLWDPSQMISSGSKNLSDEEVVGLGCVCLQELHNTPVYCIEINSLRPNLIVSGGSEVYLHNIEKNISEPEVFSPGQPNYHEGSFVTSVNWNRQVQHIFASASQNGLTVIWDLKSRKPIFNFSDNNNAKRKVICSWNPEIATQIAVVYDDEKYPELQIWDLRNPQGAVISFPHNQSRGIHGLDWCLRDPSLIMTAGRDNRVYFHNYKTGELILDNPLNSEISSVKWSPKLPGIYSVSYSSGESSVFSINDENHQVEGDWAPDWVKPKFGARFSFDGRLVYFSEKNGSVIEEYHVSDINPELKQAVEELEMDFGTGDANVAAVSDRHSLNMEYTQEEREEWNLIKLQSASQTKGLVRFLGYNEKEIIKKAETYTGKTHKKREEEVSAGVNSNQKTSKPSFVFAGLSMKEANSFFDQISEIADKPKEKPHKGDLNVAREFINEENEKEILVPETVSKNTNWNAGIEKIVKTNILIGNIEGAIDCLLKSGRTAEALLLAYSKGTDLFQSTISAYFVQSKDQFVRTVIKNLVDNKLDELVQSYALDAWKECVAICASLSVPKQFLSLMDSLGDRFLNEKHVDNAVLCYILSHNVPKILDIYLQKYKEYPRNANDQKIFLIRSFEKILTLKNLIGDHTPNNIFDKFTIEIAILLNNLDKPELALRFLDAANLHNPAVLRIRDRIFHSKRDVALHFKLINPPFAYENVSIKMKVQQRGGQHQHQTGTQGQFGGNQGGFGGNQGGMGGNQPGQFGKKPVGPTGGGMFKPNPDVGTSKPIFDNKPKPNPFGPQGGSQVGGQEINERPPISMGGMGGMKKPNDFNTPPVNKPLNPVNKFANPYADNTQVSSPINPNLSGSQTLTSTGTVGGGVTNMPPSNPNKGKFIPPPVKSTGLVTPVTKTLAGPTGGDIEPPIKKSMPGPMGGSDIGKPPNTFPSNPNAPKSGFTQTGFQGPTQEQNPLTSSGTITSIPEKKVMNMPPPKMTPLNKPMPSFTGTANTGGITSPTGGMGMGGPGTGFGGTGGMDSSQTLSKPPQKTIPQPNQLNKPPTGFPTNQPKPNQGFNQPPPTKTIQPQQQEPEEPQYVDATSIPSKSRVVYDTLNELLTLIDAIEKNPARQNEIVGKFQKFYVKLADDSVNPKTLSNAVRMCQEINNQNLAGAFQYYQAISKDDWEANKDWMLILKRLLSVK
eukprot:CAMPEP_0176439328 /NCGR_PEP_ID=MMETSP0127-20121128/19875_1 /TAXON_ID=938130 /ORGANISM="Platyophrya macrostoma, Strain WH" /LENGTH=1227 /DNA_ID=CAMNT_0017823571 /DNA_START=210 /DNA_END=3893 /DNA_ORIENTATION=-